ncbi:ZPR1 zinc finger domain-containing protein [[Eubacterium] cellulosolvens]
MSSTTREYRLPEANCPSCNGAGLDVVEVEYNVESFGPVLMSVTKCISCGFRHSDVFSLSTHEPTATSVRIISREDLKIRVVRGNTATILVPELGVTIQPGLNNEGFISNIEGVLARIEDVLRFLARSVKGRGRQRAGQVLAKIARARKGRAKFSVILKDPFGNSTIISEKAKKRRMGARELNRLKFGEQAIVARQRS